MHNLTSIKHIRQICKDIGLQPSKERGQNFLLNSDVIDKMIQSAELDKQDTVLEIGPGLGILTQSLVNSTHQVIAVEWDKRLHYFLKQHFKDCKNLKLIRADFLDIYQSILDKELYQTNYKVVANLPYQISSNVLRNLLEVKHKPKLAVVMLQKEVGDRIIETNNKSSLISLMVNFYARSSMVAKVNKVNFWPPPKVDSVVLKLDDIKNIDEKYSRQFFKLARLGFANKRKMLKNNLATLFERELLNKIFKELGLSAKVRAEDLALAEWKRLVEKLA